jgi:hypothetical protein
MALYKITAFVDTDHRQVVDDLRDAIAELLCPYANATEFPECHTCPNPWFLMVSEVPPEERQDYEDLLNH